MRILRIADQIVDIDDETAIGITLQGYDMKQPGVRFVNVSNTFSIPKTSNNSNIIGCSDNLHSESNILYDYLYCNYWIENEQIITNSKVKIVEITDKRISLYVYEKQDIWSELKKIKFGANINTDGIFEYGLSGIVFNYMKTFTNFYHNGNKYSGIYEDFISTLLDTEYNVILPQYYTNMKNWSLTGNPPFVETESINMLSEKMVFRDVESGHLCVYIKTIFQALAYHYNVDFSFGGGLFPGNIWDDPIVKQIYIPFRDLVIDTDNSDNWWFDLRRATTILDASDFSPLSKDIQFCTEKTGSDFVNAFFNHFNIVKDEYYNNGVHTIQLSRFDDIETLSDVIDWSSKVSEIISFKPYIEGFAQNNLIKFKNIYPEGNELINSKTIVCLNKNIDENTDILGIDSYIPGIISNVNSILDLSTAESFQNFTFLINSGTKRLTVVRFNNEGILYEVSVNINIAAIYSLSGEYNFWTKILEKPKYYEIKKWLSTVDIKDFRFSKQYYIRELNGAFFVNRIKDYNPEKSKEPTTIELIKVSNRTPFTPPDLNYWIDGAVDAWTDGELDFYF